MREGGEGGGGTKRHPENKPQNSAPPAAVEPFPFHSITDTPQGTDGVGLWRFHVAHSWQECLLDGTMSRLMRSAGCVQVVYLRCLHV